MHKRPCTETNNSCKCSRPEEINDVTRIPKDGKKLMCHHLYTISVSQSSKVEVQCTCSSSTTGLLIYNVLNSSNTKYSTNINIYVHVCTCTWIGYIQDQTHKGGPCTCTWTLKSKTAMNELLKCNDRYWSPALHSISAEDSSSSVSTPQHRRHRDQSDHCTPRKPSHTLFHELQCQQIFPAKKSENWMLLNTCVYTCILTPIKMYMYIHA